MILNKVFFPCSSLPFPTVYRCSLLQISTFVCQKSDTKKSVMCRSEIMIPHFNIRTSLMTSRIRVAMFLSVLYREGEWNTEITHTIQDPLCFGQRGNIRDVSPTLKGTRVSLELLPAEPLYLDSSWRAFLQKHLHLITCEVFQGELEGATHIMLLRMPLWHDDMRDFVQLILQGTVPFIPSGHLFIKCP